MTDAKNHHRFLGLDISN